MANKVIHTNTGSFKFIKPDYIVATMFTGAEVDESKPLGDSYILEDVVEDTTSISQNDNETHHLYRKARQVSACGRGR